MSKPNVSEPWIERPRRKNKTGQSKGCLYFPDGTISMSKDALCDHPQPEHPDKLESFRDDFVHECEAKRTLNDDKSPLLHEPDNTPQREALPTRSSPSMLNPDPPLRTLLGLDALGKNTPNASDNFTMRDMLENDGQPPDLPRKRQVIGDRISAGSMSPSRENSPEQLSRRSNGRPNSAPYSASTDDLRGGHELVYPVVAHIQLLTADQATFSPCGNVDPSNVASIQTRKNRLQPPAATSTPSYSGSSKLYSVTSRTEILPVVQSPKRSQRQSLDEVFSLKRQPETRPIPQEQLVAEVKGIYAGLVMVEARCIEVDAKHATLAQGDSKTQPKISNEQWQALIALHRTLLHEHHDFFLASQHPSASVALRRLASEYAMPARMWRHGIHAFLELLRNRLQASIDHMLAFIYLAYSMMALLYETVPAFEDTWIECLGDLARYRMAIEEDDIRDREVWTSVARHWYSKASGNAPTTGRLYHHLAILARPNALQQLFYYSKSLCVEIPFTSARESILTLFEPVLNPKSPTQYRLPPFETAFIKAHGVLFTGKELEGFEAPADDFLDLLDAQIGRVTRKFMEQGYYIAIANCAALVDFASSHSVMMKAITSSQNKPELENASPKAVEDMANPVQKFRLAEKLHNKTLDIVLQRIGDPNVLPFLHLALVWLLYVSNSDSGMDLIKDNFPWKTLATMLNTLVGSCRDQGVIEAKDFPLTEKDEIQPLPEDDAMRGLLWAVPYFPEPWFKNNKIDEDEKYREVASMTQDRKERILWLACTLCKRGPWLKYTSGKFSAPDVEKEQNPSHASIE